MAVHEKYRISGVNFKTHKLNSPLLKHLDGESDSEKWQGKYTFLESPPAENELKFVLVSSWAISIAKVQELQERGIISIEDSAADIRKGDLIKEYCYILLEWMDKTRRYFVWPLRVNHGVRNVSGPTIEKPWEKKVWISHYSPETGGNDIPTLRRGFKMLEDKGYMSGCVLEDDKIPDELKKVDSTRSLRQRRPKKGKSEEEGGIYTEVLASQPPGKVTMAFTRAGLAAVGSNSTAMEGNLDDASSTSNPEYEDSFFGGFSPQHYSQDMPDGAGKNTDGLALIPLKAIVPAGIEDTSPMATAEVDGGGHVPTSGDQAPIAPSSMTPDENHQEEVSMAPRTVGLSLDENIQYAQANVSVIPPLKERNSSCQEQPMHSGVAATGTTSSPSSLQGGRVTLISRTTPTHRGRSTAALSSHARNTGTLPATPRGGGRSQRGGSGGQGRGGGAPSNRGHSAPLGSAVSTPVSSYKRQKMNEASNLTKLLNLAQEVEILENCEGNLEYEYSSGDDTEDLEYLRAKYRQQKKMNLRLVNSCGATMAGVAYLVRKNLPIQRPTVNPCDAHNVVVPFKTFREMYAFNLMLKHPEIRQHFVQHFSSVLFEMWTQTGQKLRLRNCIVSTFLSKQLSLKATFGHNPGAGKGPRPAMTPDGPKQGSDTDISEGEEELRADGQYHKKVIRMKRRWGELDHFMEFLEGCVNHMLAEKQECIKARGGEADFKDWRKDLVRSACIRRYNLTCAKKKTPDGHEENEENVNPNS